MWWCSFFHQTGQTWSYICSDSFSSSEQFPRLEYDGGDNEGGGVADDVANESLLSSKAISGGGGEKSSGGGGEKSSSSIPPFPQIQNGDGHRRSPGRWSPKKTDQNKAKRSNRISLIGCKLLQIILIGSH